MRRPVDKARYVHAKLHLHQSQARTVIALARLLEHAEKGRALVWCVILFCTYRPDAAKAALARVTFARMSEALAVQMKGLGLAL